MLKPSIPLVGHDGVELHDEVELELCLSPVERALAQWPGTRLQSSCVQVRESNVRRVVCCLLS